MRGVRQNLMDFRDDKGLGTVRCVKPPVGELPVYESLFPRKETVPQERKTSVVVTPVDAVSCHDLGERIAHFKYSHERNWGGMERVAQKRPARVMKNEPTPAVPLVVGHCSESIFFWPFVARIIGSGGAIKRPTRGSVYRPTPVSTIPSGPEHTGTS